ncbi:toxin-antitoxin system YwqK family antitoxin, partial [Seonamhaeicola algicola]
PLWLIMRKLTYILILLLLFNCNSEKKEIFQEYNGQLVKVEFDDSKTDSTFSGYGGEHYPNGNLKSLSLFKNGEPIDTLFYYYENGMIKEKGLVKNGLQDGWWTYFRENGTLKEKIEWKPKGNDTIYKNQSLVFDNNGKLKMEPSTYFELEIPDTIVLGKNIAFVKNYVSNFKNVDERFLSVIIENKYADNTIKKDTFSDGTLKPFFGIFGLKTGKQIVKGQIEEKILQKEKINKDSSSLTIIDHYKYFEKEVFVSDNEEISEKSKKIIKDYFKSKENN